MLRILQSKRGRELYARRVTLNDQIFNLIRYISYFISFWVKYHSWLPSEMKYICWRNAEVHFGTWLQNKFHIIPNFIFHRRKKNQSNGNKGPTLRTLWHLKPVWGTPDLDPRDLRGVSTPNLDPCDLWLTLLGLEPATPMGFSRSSRPWGTGHKLSATFPHTSVSL